MSNKVSCLECGVAILVSTAERNGGLCMPCKGGYKDREEEFKRYCEKQKKYYESGEYKFWCWLAKQACDENDFAKLAHPCKLYFATRLLREKVYDGCYGGLEKFFTDSSADYYNYTVEGLQAMDALETLRLLSTAKQLLFGNAEVPATQSERFYFLYGDSKGNEYNELLNKITQKTECLEDEFYSEELTEIDDCLEKFEKKYALVQNFQLLSHSQAPSFTPSRA